MSVEFADFVDAVVGIDSRVGSETPHWTHSDEFAIQRLKLGASLTVLTSAEGEVVRYTIHHIGAPYKLTPALGARLLAGLPLRECWSADKIGQLDLKGATLTLYQAQLEKKG